MFSKFISHNQNLKCAIYKNIQSQRLITGQRLYLCLIDYMCGELKMTVNRFSRSNLRGSASNNEKDCPNPGVLLLHKKIQSLLLLDGLLQSTESEEISMIMKHDTKCALHHVTTFLSKSAVVTERDRTYSEVPVN